MREKRKGGSLSMRNDSKIFKGILTGFIADDDPLLSMMKWMMEQLMKIESEMKVGAKKAEHNSERKSYFSGYSPCRFDTRLGTVYQSQKRGYLSFFITEKGRSEQALISMIKEAYVNGVSTIKIERLAKEFGIERIFASQVSQINKGLDEHNTKRSHLGYRNNGKIPMETVISFKGKSDKIDG